MEERAVARDQGGERVDVANHGVDRMGRHAPAPKGPLRLEERTPRLAEALEEQATVRAAQFGWQ